MNYIDIAQQYCLNIFSTSYSIDFLALNDDVKHIISKHLQSDFKIRKMLSKYHDLQKILCGEIDDDFCKILKITK